MAKRKKKKEFGCPAVTRTFEQGFKEDCEKTKRYFNRVQGGKGSSPRSNNSPEYLNNYSEINWGRDTEKDKTNE